MSGADIYSTLSGHAGLTALVSTRIFRRVLPQNVAYPAVSFFQVSDSPISGINGHSGLENQRWQVDAYGSTAVSVDNVIEQIKDAMETSSDFKSVRLLQSDEPYDFDEKIYRVSIDFSVWQ